MRNSNRNRKVNKRERNTVYDSRDKHTKRQERGEEMLIEDVKGKNFIAEQVKPKNQTQAEILDAIRSKQVTVFRAPAGCGKTYLTMCECTDWLKQGHWDKLYLTRPAVGMGKSIAALPGDMRQKFEPFMLPCVDVITSRYGKGFYETALTNGVIEFVVLEYIRGRNLNELIVLDEAQNVTPDEMYTILTRVAEGGKLIVLGDPNQNDLHGKNGIDWLCEFVEENPELKEYITIIDADSDDIVRGGLCKLAVKAKERSNKKGVI